MLKTRRILTGFCTLLCFAVSARAEVPGKDELISLYAKSLDLVQKVTFTSESNTIVIEPRVGKRQNEFVHVTFSRDGERLASTGFQRIISESGKMVALTNQTQIIDRRSMLVSSNPDGRASVYVQPDKDIAMAKLKIGAGLIAGQVTRGILQGMTSDLPPILRASDANVTVRREMEDIDGHQTYVLEYQGKEGSIIFWLDPNAAYHPRRLTVQKSGDDLFEGEPLTTFRFRKPHLYEKKLKEVTDVFDSVEIEDVNGVFMITGGKMSDTQLFADGNKLAVECVFRFFDIDLNPDFDVLKPFDLKVPDGTPVNDADFPGGSFEVRQGKIVSGGTSFEQIDKVIEGLK
jgi:hypothetical protein